MSDQVSGILLSLVLVGIGVTFGVLAVGIAVKLVGAYRASIRSREWPTTPGRVTHSEMVWVGARSRSPRPEIKYTYVVDRTPYEGRRILFEYSHVYSREAVEEMLKEYPVGATAQVYYDPANPQESTLRQAHVGVVSGLIVGVMLVLPMALCLGAGLVGFLESLKAR